MCKYVNMFTEVESWWGRVLIVDVNNICMCLSCLCACVHSCAGVNYLQVLQCGRWAGWEWWREGG